MRQNNNINWRQEYPQMPDSFHQALVQEIERQYEKEEAVWEEKTLYSGKQRTRWAVALAAAALCGMTVYAASHFRLTELFWGRISPETADRMIETELQVIQPENLHISSAVKEEGMEEVVAERPTISDTSDLLDIKETLFDGMTLYIYAVPTDNGKNYDLNSDRIYINNVETGPVSTRHIYPGTPLASGTAEQEMYTFEVDLSELDLTEDFDVTLPLSVYERTEGDEQAMAVERPAEQAQNGPVRYQNQDLTFPVAVIETAVKYADQTFSCEEFTLEITNLATAGDTLKAVFYYRMTPEQLEAYRSSGETLGTPALRNEEEKEYELLTCSIQEMEDGIRIKASYFGLSGGMQKITVESVEWNRFQEGRIATENIMELRKMEE